MGEKKNFICKKNGQQHHKNLIKRFWKRCVILPLNSLQRGMTLPFWCSLSLMTLPFEASALPNPRKNIRSLTKHVAIDIADPSSIQDACHAWTQIVFFVSRSWQDEKISFSTKLGLISVFFCHNAKRETIFQFYSQLKKGNVSKN